MAQTSQPRISVVQRNRVVPLLPGDAVRERAPQAWRSTLLERHRVSAIEIPEHEHREFCLHLQVSGTPELEWWSEGKNRMERTAPGSLILLAAGTRDRLRWSESSERLVVSLDPELLRRAGAMEHAAEFANQWSLKDAALEHLVKEMASEAEAQFPLGRLYAELLELGLANTLLRRHGSGDSVQKADRGGLPMPKLRHAMGFMTENLERDLALEEIAAEAGLSTFHFARAFRATTGQTPYQYLLDQRIDRAKFLLQLGSLSGQEIAEQTGFGSATNFVRAFRQRVGVTPKVWREQVL